MTVFYKLPADLLQEGLSTDDGQDIIDVTDDDGYVYATVYTPSDDPDEDNERRCAPETRIYSHDDLVDLAVFDRTRADLSGHPAAVKPRVYTIKGAYPRYTLYRDGEEWGGASDMTQIMTGFIHTIEPGDTITWEG